MRTWVPFNINHTVRVKLTERGRLEHRKNHDEIAASFPNSKITYSPPAEDADGWSEWQLWDLMQHFGEITGMGSALCFETFIEFAVEESK